MVQERFKSRSGFILASVGAAVGLGNALRFPGLCAKYGGGTFLFIYFVALVVMGIPVLNAEIALGRKFRGGAPKCMGKLYPKAKPLGWASCFNSLFVAVIYIGLLGWILAMAVKIAPLTVSAKTLTREEIGGYFFESVLNGISPLVLVFIFLGWIAAFFCLKGGAQALSKTAKFTVIIPIVLLLILAGRGLIYENSGTALYALFVPDFSAFANAELWLNALGQVFFSLSIMVGIMPSYGACLPEGTNIFRDSLIIAAADFLVSVLASVVMFTTMYGCGLENSINESGIVTAFIVYPVALTRVFGAGTVLSAIAGVAFYSSLAMMAAQSAVSMANAVAGPLSETFNLSKKKIALGISLVGCALSVIFATPAAKVALDISDHYLNYFNVLILGVAESVILGASAKRENLAGEINRYTKKIKMPKTVLTLSLKYFCPAVLGVTLMWGIFNLVFTERGIYAGYPLWAQAAFGWTVSLIVFSSGYIIGLIQKISIKKPLRRV